MLTVFAKKIARRSQERNFFLTSKLKKPESQHPLFCHLYQEEINICKAAKILPFSENVSGCWPC